MVKAGPRGKRVIDRLLPGRNARTGEFLRLDKRGDGVPGEDAPRDLQDRRDRLPVARRPQEPGADDRGIIRRNTGDVHRTRRLRADRVGHEEDARVPGQPQVRARGVERHRDEQALDVGARCSGRGLELADQVVAAGRQCASAGRQPAKCLPGLAGQRAEPARRVARRAERDLEGNAALLDQALAHLRRLGPDPDAALAEQRRVADAGAFEQKRRLDAARAEDDLAVRPDVARGPPGVGQRHPGHPRAVEGQRDGAGPGGDRQAATATATTAGAAASLAGKYRADERVVGGGAAAAGNR